VNSLLNLPRWAWVTLGETLVVGIPIAAALLSHPTAFPWALTAAIIGALCLPLRLRWPWLAMLISLPALSGGLGWPVGIIALYRIGRVYHRVPVVIAWCVLGLLAFVVPLHIEVSMPWQDRVMSVAFAVVGLFGPAAFGALMRVRRELTFSLVELRRARSAELEARLDGARSAERARIAREIHDAVGHHSTLIAVQAAALAATAPDEPTRETALRLRVLAKESLSEMRAALGLLNDGPPSGLTDLPDLLTRVRRTGLHIDFEGQLQDVNPVTGRAIYRIIQETLTNVTKHAPASTVEIKLIHSPAHVLVSVINGPPPHVAPRPSDSGGMGLEGLAERVRILGGTLTCSSLPNGGFSALAELPLPTPTKVAPAHSTSGGSISQSG
jgi:signal transduction histidine kinase